MHRIIILSICIHLISCLSSMENRSVNERDPGFLLRASVLTDFVADHYVPPSLNIPDPEKFYWPKVMARFEKYGIRDSLANSWIDQLKHRSPFHFTLAGMARLMSLYPDAPAIYKNRILLLEKVFERTDSHNPWTSEGTENHINMERTSGYLYAQHALEYPDLFPEAAEKLALMKEWIQQWSSMIYRKGTGEWNSSIYQTYHIIGWLNLYDFANDQEVRDMARAVLDYYAAESALHYSWGAYGGSEKRGRGVRDEYSSATEYLGWLWFGNQSDSLPFTRTGGEYIQSMHAVTSNYFPNKAIVRLAKKQFDKPSWTTGSKPSYLFEEQSFVRQFYYVHNNFTLGTAVSPYGGWTGSTYQIVNWKLVSRTDDDHPVMVSGNGRFHEVWSGGTANPWTQFAQHKNVLAQVTRTPSNAGELIRKVSSIVDQWKLDWQRDFSLRFPGDDKPNVVNFAGNIIAENKSFINLPGSANLVFHDDACFTDLGNVYLAIYYLSNGSEVTDQPLYLDNRKILVDQAEPGNACGFILEVADASEHNGFDDFVATCLSERRIDRSALSETYQVGYVSVTGDSLSVTFNTDGCFTEATYDWGYGPVEQQVVTFAAEWKQPEWPCGEGYGKIPEWSVNGSRVQLEGLWPVYDGPQLRLNEGILSVEIDHLLYRIDYSGTGPQFLSNRDD